MNAYTEQPRPQFPVSWKTFVSGVMSEFARAKARAAGAPEKYVYLFWDSGRRPQLYDNERTDKPSQIAARAFCPMPGVKND